MGTTGAQFAQHASDVAQRDRQRKEALTDEQRQARENLLADGYQKGQLTPAQAAKGIEDLYAHEPQESRIHRLGRFLSRKPAPAKGPSPKADFQGIVAGEKTPEQLQQEQFNVGLKQKGQQRDADMQEYQRLVTAHPEQRQMIDALFGMKTPPKWQPFKLPSGQIRSFDLNDPSSIPPDATEVDLKTATKTTRPALKNIGGNDVLWDADKQVITKVLGVHGSIRKSVTDDFITDKDGVVHKVKKTTISTPEGEQIEVEDQSDEGGEQPKPKAKNAPAPRKSGPPKDETLPFQKSTPAITKAQDDYRQAIKLDETATLIEADPNPSKAVKQHRFAIVLEKMAAGRFTEQALRYALSAGVANSFEEMVNKLDKGQMPDDVFRQLLESAHENLTASKTAMDALTITPNGQPAPKAGGNAASDLNKKLDEAMK